MAPTISKLTPSSRINKEKKISTPKQVFRGKEISLSGTFTNCGKPAPKDQIAGWIRAHGGTFVDEVSEGTTHLICSVPDFKSRSKQVKRALQNDDCAIITFDWLLESLVRVKKTCRPTKPYILKEVAKRLNKALLGGKKLESQFKEGVKTDLEFCHLKAAKVNPMTSVPEGCNAIYYDDTGFEYKVEMRRETKDEKIVIERYTLFIFQSICKPHTHIFGAKYTSSKHRHTSYHRGSTSPRLFKQAFNDFKFYFKEKTGSEWDLRLEGYRNKEKFAYEPPAAGKPVGQLPYDYVRPVPKVRYGKPIVEQVEDTEEDGDVEIEDWHTTN